MNDLNNSSVADNDWAFDGLSAGARSMARKWRGAELALVEWTLPDKLSWTNEAGESSLKVVLKSDIQLLRSQFCGEISSGEAISGRSVLVPRGERCLCEGIGPGTFCGANLRIPDETLEQVLGTRESVDRLKARFDYYDPFLLQTVQYLRALMKRTDDLSDMMGETLVRALCLHLCSDPVTSLSAERLGSALAPKTARRMEDYVQANLHGRVTLDDLVELTGMPMSEFMTAFRSTFGMTPTQFLITQRLERAKRLLMETNLDVCLVAMQSGFFDNSHLTRFFKRAYDLTPKEFRHRHNR